MKTITHTSMLALIALSNTDLTEGAEEPSPSAAIAYVAQDSDGRWFSYSGEPHTTNTKQWASENDEPHGYLGLLCESSKPVDWTTEVYKLIREAQWNR